MKKSPTRTRRPQIQNRHELAGGNATQRPRRSTNPHVDDVGRVAYKLELGRQIRELERNPQRALDNLFTRHEEPDQRREDDRQNLQSEVPEAGKCHSGKRARGFGAEQPRAATPDDEA